MTEHFSAVLQDNEELDGIQTSVVSKLVHPDATEGVEIVRADISEGGVQYRNLKKVADSVVEELAKAGYEVADYGPSEFTSFSAAHIAILSGKPFQIVKKED